MRLFIAIDLGDEVRDAVGRQLAKLQPLAPNAKWVKVEGMHVTLAFLGYIDDARVPEVKAIAEEVARRHGPVSFSVEGIGSFGSSARPRVLWVGMTGDVEALAALKSDLEDRLAPLGYEPEKRPFKPHLTLARARMPSGDPALARCIRSCGASSFGHAQVDRIILFRSDLSAKGARYTALYQPRLGGKAAQFSGESK
jgi:RNA 2',3'-cyclic 3'-phosphodiesterase